MDLYKEALHGLRSDMGYCDICSFCDAQLRKTIKTDNYRFKAPRAYSSPEVLEAI